MQLFGAHPKLWQFTQSHFGLRYIIVWVVDVCTQDTYPCLHCKGYGWTYGLDFFGNYPTWNQYLQKTWQALCYRNDYHHFSWILNSEWFYNFSSSEVFCLFVLKVQAPLIFFLNFKYLGHVSTVQCFWKLLLGVKKSCTWPIHICQHTLDTPDLLHMSKSVPYYLDRSDTCWIYWTFSNR